MQKKKVPKSCPGKICVLLCNLSFLPEYLFPLSTPNNPMGIISLVFIMGTGKKEATRKVRQGKTGDGLGNVKVKGENFYRCVGDLEQRNMKDNVC